MSGSSRRSGSAGGPADLADKVEEARAKRSPRGASSPMSSRSRRSGMGVSASKSHAADAPASDGAAASTSALCTSRSSATNGCVSKSTSSAPSAPMGAGGAAMPVRCRAAASSSDHGKSPKRSSMSTAASRPKLVAPPVRSRKVMSSSLATCRLPAESTSCAAAKSLSVLLTSFTSGHVCSNAAAEVAPSATPGGFRSAAFFGAGFWRRVKTRRRRVLTSSVSSSRYWSFRWKIFTTPSSKCATARSRNTSRLAWKASTNLHRSASM
mmetsp:Transcript_44202/g.127705  ORF Transcript_44202/g.127705 Transcript_44202/m.127705 type:complete len:267 (-) Transcript_44202:91-891(-)